MKNRPDLTQGKILSNIWYLALPIVLTNLLQDAFNLVDMYFVGKLSPGAIAAVSMSGIILGLMMTAVMGISLGTIALISQAVGGGNIEKADEVVGQSLLLGLFITAIVTSLGFLFAAPMLGALGAEEEVVILGVSYIRIMCLGSGTIFLTILMFSALRGAGDPIIPMVALTISTILNITLDPIMIFGLFGFPKLEVGGSALATVISRTVALIIVLWALTRQKSIIKLRLRDLRPNFKIQGKIVKIGLFASIESVVIHLSGLLLIVFVAAWGTNTVAAYGIGMRLNFAVMIPVLGLGMASATLIGQNLGANKADRAEKSGWLCALFGVIIMGSLSAFFLLFPGQVIAFFNNDLEVVAIGEQFIRWVTPTLAFIGLAIVLGRSLGGAGDTFHPMLFTGISLLVIRILLADWLPNHMGLIGIWIAIGFSNIIHGILITIWFKAGRWKQVRIVK